MLKVLFLTTYFVLFISLINSFSHAYEFMLSLQVFILLVKLNHHQWTALKWRNTVKYFPKDTTSKLVYLFSHYFICADYRLGKLKIFFS